MMGWGKFKWWGRGEQKVQTSNKTKGRSSLVGVTFARLILRVGWGQVPVNLLPGTGGGVVVLASNKLKQKEIKVLCKRAVMVVVTLNLLYFYLFLKGGCDQILQPCCCSSNTAALISVLFCVNQAHKFLLFCIPFPRIIFFLLNLYNVRVIFVCINDTKKSISAAN